MSKLISGPWHVLLPNSQIARVPSQSSSCNVKPPTASSMGFWDLWSRHGGIGPRWLKRSLRHRVSGTNPNTSDEMILTHENSRPMNCGYEMSAWQRLTSLLFASSFHFYHIPAFVGRCFWLVGFPSLGIRTNGACPHRGLLHLGPAILRCSSILASVWS